MKQWVFHDKDMQLMRLPDPRQFSDAELARLAKEVTSEATRREVVRLTKGD